MSVLVHQGSELYGPGCSGLSQNNFGRLLKTIRKSKRLTQEQLAEKCGVDNTYICLLENGHRDPSLSNFVKLCCGLQCSPNDLLMPAKPPESGDE